MPFYSYILSTDGNGFNHLILFLLARAAKMWAMMRVIQGAMQEEGQPGKSDYQTWKILVAVLVPSFIVGALVVASWHSMSICKCPGSASNGTETEVSAASPPAEGRTETKASEPAQNAIA